MAESRFSRLACGLALGLLLGACEAEREPVVAVAMGDTELIGGLLALEEMGPGSPFDTVFRPTLDSRAAPAIAIAQELVAMPGMLAVIGHSNSAASLATAPIYNQNRIIQLSPNATATTYSDAGPYSFRLAPPDIQQAQFLAEVLVERFGGQSAALLYENDEYGRELRRELRAAAPANAIEWVIDSPHLYEQDEVTAARLADAVVAARPDVIVWLGREFTARTWFRRLRQGLGPVPIIGSDGLSALALRRDEELATENIWFVDLVHPEATPGLRAFRASYEQRFGHSAMGAQALTYDAVMLVAAAVRDGVRTGDELREWLDSLGRTRPAYRGITGDIAFDENGDVLRKHVLCTIRDEVVCQ